MKIPASLGRKLLAFLDHVGTEAALFRPEARELAASLRRYNQPKRSIRAARARRDEKRTTRREEMAALREAVMKRAGGKCEACGMSSTRLHCDHWQGGVGRRRAEQSIATTWALCPSCDFARTRNNPDAETWNRTFAAHCAEHGYPFRPHLTRKPLELAR